VRVDGAFIPFRSGLDLEKVTTEIPGVWAHWAPGKIDLQSKVSTIVGRKVAKVRKRE